MRERLIDIQKREGWNDRQMAVRLQCSRPLWNLVKNGHKPVSDDLAVRAAGAFPELSADLLDRAAKSVTNRAA